MPSLIHLLHSSTLAEMPLSDRSDVLLTAWKALCRCPWSLLIRYAVWPVHRRIPVWEKLWWCVFHALRLGGILFSKRLHAASWHPGLKHGCTDPITTLIIINDLQDSAKIKQACVALKEYLASFPKVAPVLVTDHADFALYSRLGWLVEYLPKTFPNADEYIDRKLRYLAWRYKYAEVIPLSAGLAPAEECNYLLKQVVIHG